MKKLLRFLFVDRCSSNCVLAIIWFVFGWAVDRTLTARQMNTDPNYQRAILLQNGPINYRVGLGRIKSGPTTVGYGMPKCYLCLAEKINGSPRLLRVMSNDEMQEETDVVIEEVRYLESTGHEATFLSAYPKDKINIELQ